MRCCGGHAAKAACQVAAVQAAYVHKMACGDVLHTAGR
jgi:hypothetical protein